MQIETPVRSPNRIGIFATVISLIVTLAGLLLVLFAGYDSLQKTLAGIVLIFGFLGTVTSYLLVRIFFWAFYPKPNQQKKQPHRHTPTKPPPNLKGIAGWLILPLIGMFITPFFGLANIIKSWVGADTFYKLTIEWQLLIATEIILMVAIYVVAPLYLLYLMFKWDRHFPSRYIVWSLLASA